VRSDSAEDIAIAASQLDAAVQGTR
jgi:hypothetical protein